MDLCSPQDNTSTSLPIMEASLNYVAAKRASRPVEAQNGAMDDQPPIDFFQALQRGLERIARVEPTSGSTEHLRRPGEHPAPTRTAPVPELDLSISEFLKQSERLRKDL